MKKGQIKDKSGDKLEVYFLAGKPELTPVSDPVVKDESIILKETLPAAGKPFELEKFNAFAPNALPYDFPQGWIKKVLGSHKTTPVEVELDDSLDKDVVTSDQLVFLKSYKIKGLNIIAKFVRRVILPEMNFWGVKASGDLADVELCEFEFCGVYFWVRRDMILNK